MPTRRSCASRWRGSVGWPGGKYRSCCSGHPMRAPARRCRRAGRGIAATAGRSRASWIFYGWWDARFVLLLIASGVLNWGVARLILAADAAPRLRTFWLAAGIAINLGILGFFKYYGFFMVQLGEMLHLVGWQRDL